MIQEIVTAALDPLTTTAGWAAFCYGVVGKIAAIYAKNFIGTVWSIGKETNEKTEEDISGEEAKDG